ncbi:unnamed protein product [Choristocarpus tenellus]
MGTRNLRGIQPPMNAVLPLNPTTRNTGLDSVVRGDGHQLPLHLVVLVHGLKGKPEDMTYLKEALDSVGGSNVLVHLARCNEKNTFDGVVNGGTRLAKEIEGVIKANPSLAWISVVGNSLGGLYSRYAVKLLFRREQGVTPEESSVLTAEAVAAKADATSRTRAEVRDSLSTGFVVTAELAEREMISREVSGASNDNIVRSSDIDSGVDGCFSVSRNAGVEQQERVGEKQDDGAGVCMRQGEGNRGGVKGDGKEGKVTVGGLCPVVFMTIATPNLGVRDHTYIPVPGPLRPLASVLIGRTGSDLFLDDCKKGGGKEQSGEREAEVKMMTKTRNEMLVSQKREVGERKDSHKRKMSPPLLFDMATKDEFLDSLKAFARRRVYANRRGDFMVPFGTAAFHEPGEVHTSEICWDRKAVNWAEEILGRVLGRSEGQIVGMVQVLPKAGEGEGCGSEATGLRRLRSWSGFETEGPCEEQKVSRSTMKAMVAGLNSCGWEKVFVDFGGVLPFSHNKICALSRNLLTSNLYRSGRRIMDHAADYIIQSGISYGADVCNDM